MKKNSFLSGKGKYCDYFKLLPRSHHQRDECGNHIMQSHRAADGGVLTA